MTLPVECFKKKPKQYRPQKQLNFDQVKAAQMFSIYDNVPSQKLAENALVSRQFQQQIADHANTVADMSYNTANLFKPITDTQREAAEQARKQAAEAAEQARKQAEALTTSKYKEEITGELMKQLGQQFNLSMNDIQDQLDQVKREAPLGIKVKVEKEDVERFFRNADLREVPLFSVVFDGSNYGYLGVFEELGLKDVTYFELVPEGKEVANYLRVHNKNENDHYDIPLTDRMILVLTSDSALNKDLRRDYIDMIEFTIGNKLRELKAELDVENYGEEYLAAKQVIGWAEKSQKFTEWIAPKYEIKINKATEIVRRIETGPEPGATESTEKPATEPVAPRAGTRHRRPPVPYSPSEADAEQRFKQAAARGHIETKRKQVDPSFQTPVNTPSKTDTVSDVYKLTPEGKILRKEYIDKALREGKPIPSKALLKQQIIQQSLENPVDFGENIVKKGSGVKSVIIPPKTEDRVRRLKVILGSKAAGNSADMLEEFTALLDSLLNDSKINKQLYSRVLSKYTGK